MAALHVQLDAVDAHRREIETPVTEAQATLDRLRGTIDQQQAARREGDRDVSALQSRLDKFRKQLMTVTNGREYEAVQHEIAGAEADLKFREDQVITLLFELDDLVPQADAARGVLAEQRAIAEQAVVTLDDDTGHQREALVAAERNVVEVRAALGAADRVALATYDRVSRRHPRSVVVELRNDSCSGCNVRLRQMLTTDIRRGEKIVQCESCTRILFVARPVPAPAPTR